MQTKTPTKNGCPEYHALQRRSFLRTLGQASAAAALVTPVWLPKLVFAQSENSERDLLVCVFLRGGADGLTLCVPHAEQAYYDARPTLAIPAPDSVLSNRATDLDGFFGLPPALARLKPIYDARQLAIVHATGSSHPTRSHFEAQDFMEAGTPGDSTVVTGWLARHLHSVREADDVVLRGMAASTTIPRTLGGAPKTVAITSIDEYGLVGREETRDAQLDLFREVYGSSNDVLSAAANNITTTTSLIDRIKSSPYTPAGGAAYPTDGWGEGLKTIARLAKADVGLEAACIDLDGWDTHAEQGSLNGELNGLMDRFARGLEAFHADMADRIDRTTVVVLSEFGRRVDENGSKGTDHGHGNAMFVMGGHVNGGQVITDWPELSPDALDDRRDLAITIDYRDILSEVLTKRAGNTSLEAVFPGYAPEFRGVV